MKKFLGLMLLIGFSFAVSAQGNLQFNRVVNYTINTPLAAGSSRPTQSLTVTVPAGKVWKIESAHLSYQSSTSTTYFIVNNTSTVTCLLTLNGGAIATFEATNQVSPGPVWLAEGTHTLVLTGYYNSSSSYQFNAFITGLEFNIVP